LFLAVFFVTSCRKDEDYGNEAIKAINSTIYELMQEVYLWNDHLPDLDPELYPSPEELMADLRYSEYDKWSTVITKTEFNQYFEQGQLIGHGFLLGVDENENIRVAFVYPSTSAHNQGVRRSWIITRINGSAANPGNVFDLLGPAAEGRTNSITFIDGKGETVDLNLTKEVIQINPVLHHGVIDQGNDRIGYMVFQDFIDTARTSLDIVFQAFNSTGIDELIVDMRYNGGGSVDVAEYFAGWLIGRNNAGMPFVNFRHNEKLGTMDTTLAIPDNPDGLDLDRIFFIGTGSTASASELMINGVKPYLGSVILAGSTTHGKPVGMYSFPFVNYDYVVLPVTFKYTNANDEGDFYGGIPPDLEAEDDLSHDFGDTEEASLKAVLNYLAGGAPQKMLKSGSASSRLILTEKSVGQYLKAY
jgi:C-terminal processing protease CtpA/Prc